MKRFELFFAFIQLPLDFLMFILAGFTAYSLRFAEVTTSIRPVIFNLSWEKYWPLVIGVALVWILIFALSGLYHTNPNKKLLTDLKNVVWACSTGFAGITIYVFFTLQKFDSRFLVLAGWLLAILYISLGRILIKIIKLLFYRAGIGLRRVVLVGRNQIQEEIQASFLNKKSLGYKVVGSMLNFNLSEAEKILKLKPDEIIFTDSKSDKKQTLEAIDFANENHITFKYSADLFETISTNINISTTAGVPIVELQRTPLTGWGSIIKRIFDVVVVLILITLFSPIFILTTFIILIETGRPVVYKNERVKQKGKIFNTFKFRSMYQKFCTGKQFGTKGNEALKKEQELIKTNNIKTGPVYKIKDDPRITKFGRFIRRLSIDELPQFWNVLKGEMSLVGPRPHQTREVDQYKRHHKTVLAIKPGITGLAQISGRSDLSFEEEIKLDTFYIEHWTILTDLIILIKTPFIVLKKTGAL